MPLIKDKKLTVWDYLLMLALVAITGGLLFFTLSHGHDWGDDFSVYIAEGISLSQGTFVEQTVRNGEIVNSSSPVVYVWGFPLLLAIVHKLVGFDIVNYSSLIYYKIPVAVSLMAWSIVLYLFMRKRFGQLISFTVSLFLTANPTLLRLANSILTDLPFATLVWISMYLLYAFLYQDFHQHSSQKIVFGVMLGVVIYLANITRYVGFTLLIVLGIVQAFEGIHNSIQKRKYRISVNHETIPYTQVFASILPYLVFFALYFFIGLFMPYAKTQAEDVGTVTMSTIINNINSYHSAVGMLMRSITPPFKYQSQLFNTMLFITLLGMVTAARKELPALIYLVGTLWVVLLLPYFQGIRYIINIVPCMLLFFFHGISFLEKWLSCIKSKIFAHTLRIAKYMLLVLTCFLVIRYGGKAAYTNMRNNRTYDNGAYSQDAIDMYHYIQQALLPEDIIAFTKARALSLNTNRMGKMISRRVEDIPLQANYLLLSSDPAIKFQYDAHAILRKTNRVLEEIYANHTMTLYQIHQK